MHGLYLFGVEKEWPGLVKYGGKSVLFYTTSASGDDEMSPRCWKAWDMKQIQVLCYCHDGSRYEALLLKPTHLQALALSHDSKLNLHSIHLQGSLYWAPGKLERSVPGLVRQDWEVSHEPQPVEVKACLNNAVWLWLFTWAITP